MRDAERRDNKKAKNRDTTSQRATKRRRKRVSTSTTIPVPSAPLGKESMYVYKDVFTGDELFSDSIRSPRLMDVYTGLSPPSNKRVRKTLALLTTPMKMREIQEDMVEQALKLSMR
jgi:hypothetical protein